jgi:hypothetical protein
MEQPRVLKTERTPAPVLREALHELAVAYALEQFDRQGGCAATWIFAAGTRLAWVETPLDDKDNLVFRMRLIMRYLHVHAYSFITEAYVASTVGMDKDKAEALLKHAEKHGIGSLPESMRDEVLMITSFDRNGGCSDSQWLITVREQ